MKEIFRKEVGAKLHENRLHPPIHVAPLLSGSQLAFASIAGSVLLAAMLLTPVSRTVKASGEISSSEGIVEIRAEQPGILLSTLGSESIQISEQQTLYAVRRTSDTNGSGSYSKSLERLNRKQSDSLEEDMAGSLKEHSQQREELLKKDDLLKRQTVALDQKVALQRRRVKLAKAEFARVEELVKQQFVAPSMAATREAELLDSNLLLADFERSQLDNQRESLSVRAAIDALTIKLSKTQNQIGRELATAGARELEGRALEKYTLKAPRPGHLYPLSQAVGQFVSEGQLLALLVPADATLEAQVDLAPRYVGTVAVGQEVRVRYPGFPYQRYGYHVGSVRKIESAAVGVAGRNPVSRLRVQIERLSGGGSASRVIHLRPGLPLEATVFIERILMYQLIVDNILRLNPSPKPPQAVVDPA